MTLPVLEFDYSTHPDLADNIWNAQMANHPAELTYTGPDLTLRRQTRSDAMHFNDGTFSGEIPHILSRDEYPFACTREGGGSSFVGHIPGRQNSSQGGLIAAFLVKNGIKPNMRFEVRVKNHPRGDVKTVKLNTLNQGLAKARTELQKLEHKIALEKGLHGMLMRESTPSLAQAATFGVSMLNPVTAAFALVNPANSPVIGAAVNKLNPVNRPELSIWTKAEQNARAANEALARRDPAGATAAIAIGHGHFLSANAKFQAWRDAIPLAGRRAELAIGITAIALSIVAIGAYAIEAMAATAAAGSTTVASSSTGVRIAADVEKGIRILLTAETLAEEQAGEAIIREAVMRAVPR